MNATNQELDLLPFIPPDTMRIVALGQDAGDLERRFKSINPHTAWLKIPSCEAASAPPANDRDRVDLDDAERLFAQSDLSPAEFDAVILNLNAYGRADLEALLNRMRPCLAPRGLVIATLSNPRHWRRLTRWFRGEETGPDKDDAAVTFERMTEMLTSAGLHVVDVDRVEDKGDGFDGFLEVAAVAEKVWGLPAGALAEQTRARHFIIRAAAEPRGNRLLIQTLLNAPVACDRVRILDPGRYCSAIPGVRAVSAVKSADMSIGRPDERKVFILQRTILRYPDQLGQQRMLVGKGYLVVAEIDDDPSRRPEYEQNQFLSYRGCHAVQTSTEPLAECLRQYNPNVVVFANQLTTLPEQRRHDDKRPPWLFFGALNRERDWGPLIAGINRALKRQKHRVRVFVVHDKKFFDALDTDNKRFEPFCPYEKYESMLHACDVGILPLEPNRVNSMKSDLKFLEHAGHGVAVLASPVVYEKSIHEGETGLIYRSPGDFEAKLSMLLEDAALRRRLAAAAYAWVAEHRLLCRTFRARVEWYEAMLDDLSRLTDQLRERIPEMFSNSFAATRL